MKSFKAYRISNENGQVSGEFQELTLESLGAGEVLIRVAYSSVNYKDALAATGQGKIIRRFPLIGGIDCAGNVESSTDARFSPGQAVVVTGYGMGVEHDGGYAQYAQVPADWVVPLPGELTTWEAMAIGTAGFTAALSILNMEINGLKPENGPVVVTGATGGVGSLAIDILSRRGYSVTTITGKTESSDYLTALGAKEILSRHTLTMGTQPLEKAIWAGAIDNVGGEMLAWLTRTAKLHGVITSCGLTGGTELHTTIMPFILRAVNLLGVSATLCPMETRLEVWKHLAGDMKPRHLKAITKTIGLTEIEPVFEAMLAGRVTGRTVVRPDS